MIRGIYSAANGMIAQQYVLDSIAGNLANINTAGFKQDVPTFRELKPGVLQEAANGNVTATNIGTGAAFDRTVIDLGQGTLIPSGNPTDLALVGNGFFTVRTSTGDALTRSGQFHRQIQPGVDGKPVERLVDDAGNALVGANGPIEVTGARDLTVTGDGSVQADGKVVGKLKLVTAPAKDLVKLGGNLLAAHGATTAANVVVRQSFVEQSNVSAVDAMVKMITVQRAYEAAQKAIQSQDDTLNRAVNDIGKV